MPCSWSSPCPRASPLACTSNSPARSSKPSVKRSRFRIDHGEQYKRGVQLYVLASWAAIPPRWRTSTTPRTSASCANTISIHSPARKNGASLHIGNDGKLIDSKIKSRGRQQVRHAGSITEFKSPPPAAATLGRRMPMSGLLQHGPSDETRRTQ